MGYRNQARITMIAKDHIDLKNAFIKFSNSFEKILSMYKELNIKYVPVNNCYFILEILDQKIEVKFSLRIFDDYSTSGQMAFSKMMPKGERNQLFFLFFDEMGNTHHLDERTKSWGNFNHDIDLERILFDFMNKFINYYIEKQIPSLQINELMGND